ncbi:MAG: hypothetical protein IT581_12315 [Verrucomicrobiales bacterium]|nr:hypothetical protein [Verrucomicrobiales bacterium]
MNLNPQDRQRQLGWVAAIALALLLGDHLVLSPLINGWNTRSESIAKLQKQVKQGAVLLDRESGIRQRWDQIRTNTLSRQISVAEGQMLKAFDRWTQESGVGGGAIRSRWKQMDDEHTTLECHVDTSGSLANLTRFLYLIEKDPLAVKIEAIQIVTRDNDAQQLTLGVQFSGLMLHLPGS